MSRRTKVIIVSIVSIIIVGLSLGLGLGFGLKGGVAHGLEVTAPTSQDATSGDTLSYVFTVKNAGNVEDQFSLEGASGHGWDISIPQGLLEIGSGGEVDVTV